MLASLLSALLTPANVQVKATGDQIFQIDVGGDQVFQRSIDGQPEKVIFTANGSSLLSFTVIGSELVCLAERPSGGDLHLVRITSANGAAVENRKLTLPEQLAAFSPSEGYQLLNAEGKLMILRRFQRSISPETTTVQVWALDSWESQPVLLKMPRAQVGRLAEVKGSIYSVCTEPSGPGFSLSKARIDFSLRSLLFSVVKNIDSRRLGDAQPWALMDSAPGKFRLLNVLNSVAIRVLTLPSDEVNQEKWWVTPSIQTDYIYGDALPLILLKEDVLYLARAGGKGDFIKARRKE